MICTWPGKASISGVPAEVQPRRVPKLPGTPGDGIQGRLCETRQKLLDYMEIAHRVLKGLELKLVRYTWRFEERDIKALAHRAVSD